jgi:hypothetical protein
MPVQPPNQTRIRWAIEWIKKHRSLLQKDIAEKMGMSEVSFSRSVSEIGFKDKDKFIINFNEACENVFNINYLINGIKPVFTSELPRPIVSMSKGKPYYNVDFALGFEILTNDQTSNPDYLIDFPPYNDCDCYCNAHGNSMYPTIASGDIVSLKIISDFSYLINGEIYGIVTTNGLRTIKRVRDNGDTFTLIADNPSVAEQTIPKSVVSHVFLVKGLIKQF